MNEHAGREKEIAAREKAATLVVRLRQGVVGVHYTSEEAADRIEVLEAAIRAKDAALDNYIKLEVGQRLACYWKNQWLGYRSTAQFSEILRQRDLAFDTLRAALSPDAGKGWLPPEAREQVRRAMEVAQSWIRSQESGDPARPSILVELATALDTLKRVK